jgi:hypothetical protein
VRNSARRAAANDLVVILPLLAAVIAGCAPEKPREAATIEPKDFRFEVKNRECDMRYQQAKEVSLWHCRS